MSNIIITGVDNSETAYQAAMKAGHLAVALGCELHVLSAFSIRTSETVRSLHNQGDVEHRSREFERLVDRYARAADLTASAVAGGLRDKFPGLKVISKAIEGNPGSALVREAKVLSAELIVVGNKRLQGAGRILGSVARTVATEADCDLYIVHTHPR
ncbi:universal stress protein [Nesterenkonia sphaerica]|uniref:Universal stress protein n=1 Tax=Nesterenkonia sphaerica TaxID=1804988 RepID=A0A5R9A689_9MICC|nr:universal stress protein [Nesterenkonia sphaerica]TLP74229.1 universal stress protein [Nesterenkonia sphaerica]